MKGKVKYEEEPYSVFKRSSTHIDGDGDGEEEREREREREEEEFVARLAVDLYSANSGSRPQASVRRQA
jgi:hypothetical protein